ncbi:MAG: pyruvate dehydrogenase E2 component (dihydrolipoamide acetyltransferase) PdhC [Rhodobacteraceae bacterium HLUCCA09]|nr:MAG: pyruvate dehydrogenase E2 component (dihydrolipoamide acetyltransferase) PdhC [Rhodobacteraceae bacterium HLUCCA09]
MATPITIGAAGGEYMEAVVVTKWHVRRGARVCAGDLLAEVETAKAVTEVESPCDGVLGEICAGEGDEIAVDAPLGFLLADGEDDVAAEVDAPGSTPGPPPAARPAPAADPGARGGGQPGRVVASPLARRRAGKAGLDLRHLAGSGPGGRIKRRDVEAALARGPTGEGGALPLMVLHGFAADATIWSALAAELGRGRRLIRPDLLGHGAAAPAGGGFEDVLAPVLKALDAVEAPRVHLVGHSLGGAVALALAGRRPARVASLTLIAPAGLGAEIDGATIDGICRATRPESLLPWLRRLVSDPQRIGDDYARAAMAGRGEAVRGAQAALADRLFPDGTQAVDLRSALADCALPLRLIWGRDDAILPWRQALAAPGHAALNLLPGVGHMPHVEAPELVARLLRETLAAAEAMGEATLEAEAAQWLTG